MPKMPNSPYRLEAADIIWTEDGTPQSTRFGDVYFSREDGLSETRHVFLNNNQLGERWRQLDPAAPGTFTIGETGFGTGLNFLAAWQLWQQWAPAHWRLHMVSVEKYPLTQSQLVRALQSWPELSEYTTQLLAEYPPLLPGKHRLNFGQVTLDLIFDDAITAFEQCLDTSYPDIAFSQGAKIDAWFLDGFAPSGNPGMWRDELFRAIALMSRPGTTFATFTAAGYVRRGLTALGFSVHKVPGWGRKRDMLSGQLQASTPALLPQPDIQPWHTPPRLDKIRHVAIIGAGLAGCHTAWSLARRGLKVTLLDQHGELATEASGNPQGIVYTKLSPKAGTLNQFTLASFHYAVRHYGPWLAKQGLALGDACGVIQLMRTEKERQQWLALRENFPDQPEWLQFIDAQQGSDLAGLPLEHPAIYFPQAGWLRPQAVCRQATTHPLIHFMGGQKIHQLERHAGRWQLLDGQGHAVITADAVVIASSHHARAFPVSDWLPVKAIRGQVSYLRAGSVSTLPRVALCHEGYVAPAIDDQLTLGATFDVNDHSMEIRETDHLSNLEQLRHAIPALLGDQFEVTGGRAGLRCASPDYLPMAGALPIREQILEDYASLRHNAKSVVSAPGQYHPGLYLNIAHGSRGLTSTPLCGELIAALICNEPRPLTRDLVKSLSPARFLIRGLMRNQF